jgi:hypothetical protein
VGWRIEEERKSEWFVVMTNIKAENTQKKIHVPLTERNS